MKVPKKSNPKIKLPISFPGIKWVEFIKLNKRASTMGIDQNPYKGHIEIIKLKNERTKQIAPIYIALG